jgi:uncharacterized protein (TIGR00645 family)
MSKLDVNNNLKNKSRLNIQDLLEVIIFNARWVLAPMYLGLAGILLMLSVKFTIEFFYYAISLFDPSGPDFVLGLLSLLDIVLLGNLILIVLFAGYENFVSKLEIAEENVDRPYWMGSVDFSGLKIKLIGSLVAISVIELLANFIELNDVEEVTNESALTWRVALHLTFVVSGVLFAVMDWISDNRALKARQLEMNLNDIEEEHRRRKASPSDA